ncbi:MAG: hypothetical protein WDN00_09695 [Limisphaerales bacterium]
MREHGQRLTGTGSAREKKRAVVAVARKLAVLLLSLWKHGTNYEPRATAPGADAGLNPKPKTLLGGKMDADLGVMTVRRQSRHPASPLTRWSRSPLWPRTSDLTVNRG